jgi:hypothetical protein
MNRRLPKSREEKIAEQLTKLISDLTLDLENLGRRLAMYLPNVIYSRMMIVFEAMKYERENKNDRNDI